MMEKGQSKVSNTDTPKPASSAKKQKVENGTSVSRTDEIDVPRNNDRKLPTTTTATTTSTTSTTTTPSKPVKKNQPISGTKKPHHHYGARKKPRDPITAALPIFQYEKQIVTAVKGHQTTIVVGETGSGKSTQIPQILVDHHLIQAGKGVVCTQPRRVAAVTIAQRVANERGIKLGQEVGYSIRFEDKSCEKTVIKYATDGVLLRECMSDPMLSKYSIVILDEAHERSLQTDILMGLLKQIQLKRSDLHVIVMSATLQVEMFTAFFHDSCSVIVPGRQYPVSIYYTPEPEPDFIDAALLTCLQVHEHEEDGGVLVFLPGQEDIESLQQLLQEHLPTVKSRYQHERELGLTKDTDKNKDNAGENTNDQETETQGTKSRVSILSTGTEGEREGEEEVSKDHQRDESGNIIVTIDNLQDYVIRPLYAAMPPDEQLKVFDPVKPGVRKFILSTNIAETSVTISGVKYVIDCGYVKTRLINETTGMEMLKVYPVSKSQANQRAGRAGRECAGKCYRLYTEETFEDLQEVSLPEIQRMNIAQVILQLKVLKIQSISSFPFISMPSEIVLRKGLENLFLLGALDKTQELTEHGQKMASLPLSPNFAHLLLKSVELGCVSEALTAVSLLSAENVFLQPHREEEKKAAALAHRNFASKDGDLPTLINIYLAWLKAHKDKNWTSRHYLSQRALSLAFSVRSQLSNLLTKMQIDTSSSCWPEKEPFLKCLLAGLSLNIAQKVVTHTNDHHNKKALSLVSNGSTPGKTFSFSSSTNNNNQQLLQKIFANNDPLAPYRTLRGNQPVHIHPSSVLFSMVNSKKMPGYLVYADLLTTSKQYMRNITVVEGEWITELLPQFFKSSTSSSATSGGTR